MKAPEPYSLSARLEQLDPTILSATHILEPGYSAFAVMQIASSLVSDDIGRLIEYAFHNVLGSRLLFDKDADNQIEM